MKKLMLCTILSTLFINSYSQDTICTMIGPNRVIEFNYETSEIINIDNYSGIVFIEVNDGEVRGSPGFGKRYQHWCTSECSLL